MPHVPELSVVIGAQNALATIVPCLSALGCDPPDWLEVIVVDGSRDGTADLVARRFPAVSLRRANPDWLLPQLWGEGLTIARAPLVALSNAQCLPAEHWATTIVALAARHPQAGGIGGPIDPPPGGTPLDWALYFARYSAYLPPIASGVVADIPGDNAVYRRATLDRFWTERSDGFWESLVHHRMRAAGIPLSMDEQLRVTMGGPTRLGDALRMRMRHGHHYGATRPGLTGGRRWLYSVAAPAVAPLLMLRIQRRVSQRRPDLQPALRRALPWLAVLAIAWAAGEMRGYIHGGTW